MKKCLLLFLFLLIAQFSIAQKSSAPPDYDKLIVPGDRIGPVAMGGYVDEIVKKLGKPSKEYRCTFRGPGYDADEVYDSYKKSGIWFIWFTWIDKDLRPIVESGLRGISTQSDYWSTSNGIHVGSSIQEVEAVYGEPYNFIIHDKQQSILEYDNGIWFYVKDRNSPVFQITIMPRGRF